MVIKPFSSQIQEGRNRGGGGGGTEPNKKLKKMRSVKLSRKPSLKQSRDRAKSRFRPPPIDSYSDDSTPKSFHPTEFSEGKSDSEGVSDRPSTSGSTTSTPSSRNLDSGINGGNEVNKKPKKFRSTEHPNRTQPRLHTPSVSIDTDGSPHYLKPTSCSGGCRKPNFQASPRFSESSFGSDDISNSSNSSKPNSDSSSVKASFKTRKILMNKPSFKSKRPSVKKCSEASHDYCVDRATCSSALKDSKFSPHAGIHERDSSEFERSSIPKVCPYNYCSLHGYHHREPVPIPKRVLSKKRRSLKNQKSIKLKSRTVPNVDPLSNSLGYAKNEEQKNEDEDLSEILFGEKSYPEKAFQENSNQFQTYVPEMETSLEKFSELRGTSIECCCIETKQSESVFGTANIDLEHDEIDAHLEVLDLESEDREADCGFKGGKSEIGDLTSGNDPSEKVKVSSSDFDVKATEDTECEFSEETMSQVEEKNKDFEENDEPIKAFVRIRDFEPGPTTQLNKEKQFSMWSLIHQHALLGLAVEEGTQETSTEIFGNEIEPSKVVSGTADIDSKHETIDTHLEVLNSKSEDCEGDHELKGEKLEIDDLTSGNEASAKVKGSTSDFNAKETEVASESAETISPEEEKTEDSKELCEHIEAFEPISTNPLKKEKHVSMWNLIHQHMVLGHPEEEGTQKHKREVENEQVNEAKPISPGSSLGVSESDPNIDAENHDKESKEIELRKIYAIKLVREAIEKILLPEVQDQSPNDRSVKDYSETSKESRTEIDTKKVEDDKSLDPEERRAEKKAPRSWSNLKKWILLQRFVKELEKVKKFNPKSPRTFPSEPESEKEKVRLRHPMIGERKKSSEEWMLDYALQQVVSELAPIQRRNVSLLVEAFETIVPPSEEKNILAKFSRFRENGTELHRLDSEVEGEMYTKGEEEHGVVSSDFSFSDHSKELSADGEERSREVESESKTASEISDTNRKEEEEENGDISSVSTSDPSKELNAAQEEQTKEIESESEFVSKSSDTNRKEEEKNGEISSPSVSDPSKELSASPEEESRDLESEKENVGGFNSAGDSELYRTESKEEKQISMWHLIHQHMVSGLSAESESEVPEVTDKKKKVHEPKTSGMALENQEIELRKVYAIKLVREAIEKILLPEVQDQSSDDQLVTSDGIPDAEAVEKTHGAEEKPRISTSIDNVSTSSEEERKASTVPESEKQTPKSWSRLEKLLLLKRFVKELEKVRKFNPKKPRIFPTEAEAEAEKVSLKHQITGESRNGEEWMLDYALRKVIGEMAPTQKRKVGLLVKAFETVVPSPEEQQNQVKLSKSKTISSMKKIAVSNLENGENNPTSDEQSNASNLSMSVVDYSKLGNDLYSKSDKIESSVDEKAWNMAETTKTAFSANDCDQLERPSPVMVGKNEEPEPDRLVLHGIKLEKQNHLKMWHQIYQHVVSNIAEKVLDEEDDEKQVKMDSKFPEKETSNSSHNSGNENPRQKKIEFTQSDAVKLVREAIDEILLPEIQEENVPKANILTSEEEKEESTVGINLKQQTSKNWSKIKKLILLKKSIKALENVRRLNFGEPRNLPMKNVPEDEKNDLKHQMMDERKKAEQWMLDYAVQHIVTKLTPARKRRVSLLVEAFEAVVPLPEL